MHEVIQEITESNSWRDGEFAKLKTNSSGVDQDLWCRMCVPMIYAHWEGFVVDSLKILIRYLNNLELKPDEVTTNIIVIGLGDSYRPLSGKQSFKQRITFTEAFKELFQKNLKIDKKIETKSNLNSSVLSDLCDRFSFNKKVFSAYNSDLDRLVRVRNAIAHGENSINPTLDNVIKYISSVNGAMDALIMEITKFTEKEEYLLARKA